MSIAAVHPAPADTPLPPDTASQTHPAVPQTGSTADGNTAPERSGSTMPSNDFLRRQMAHCGEYTFQALNKVGKLSPEDTGRISQQYLKHLSQTEPGRPFQDALQFLVLEGWKKKEMEARDVVLELTRALLRYSKTKISHIAFAHQTETPIEFYNNYPAISEISRLLQCPVIQISEKDFVMIASINPFTAMAAARLVSNEIEAEVGRKPFQFVATTDLNAWKYSCERHFGT
jgi:hypothetical protein